VPSHKLDELTLALYGDDDSGFGRTYAEDDEDECAFDFESKDDVDGLDREWLEIMTGRVK